MTFEPGDDIDQEDVEQTVTDSIESDGVVLFMKGTELKPQCGYSQTALELLQKHVNDVETVNVLAGPTDTYRDVLEQHSGWTTIPQVFVDGEFIGGADIIEELHSKGGLDEKLGEHGESVDPTTGPF